MIPARTLAALVASLTLSACATDPPPGPAGMITPGKDKTAAAFQQDQAICQQHALAHTGYGGPSQLTPSAPAPAEPLPTPSAPTPVSQVDPATGAAAAPAQPTDDVGFMQCMAARGDSVQVVAAGYPYPYAPYPYPYYPYPYGYSYGYPGSPFFFGGFGFHDRFHRGFHGGGFRGGFHGGGFHGGGFHGGGFHGGGHR
jgi:hypothetical protein